MNPCTPSVLIGRLSGAVVSVCLTAVCSPGFASESGCSTQMELGENHATQAKQVVSIDPDTGELVSGKMPAGASPPVRDTGSVTIRRLPDGTVTADVGDRFRSHLIAEMVDGELVTCHRTVDNHSDTVEIKEGRDE